MRLPEGTEIYIGAEVFRAGDEVPDDLAREHGLDVPAPDKPKKSQPVAVAQE